MKRTTKSLSVMLACALLLSLSACNGVQSKDSADKENTESTDVSNDQASEENAEETIIDRPELNDPVTAGSMSTEETLACTNFLSEYETWSEEFIAAAAKMMEDPSNAANKDEYKKVASKMAQWTSKWTKIQGCPDHPAYKERFSEIATRIQEELEKLEIK